jgi:hypothetical protein
MSAKEKPDTSRCNKLHELPPVVTDWQQKAWCPECDYYNCGLCGNPLRRNNSAACPFDGKELPVREVSVEVPNDQPSKPLDGGLGELPESRPRYKTLVQAIKDRILNRTGGRMRALAIELTDCGLVVRGSAPCYHVKQLALQGVFDVLNSVHQTKIGCSLEVVVPPPVSKEDQTQNNKVCERWQPQVPQ